MLKVTVVSALVAVALGDKPAPSYHPAPAYKPGPYKPIPYKEEKLPPQPFAYQYGVKDEYSGASFEKSENQDSYGNLEGSYRVALPDGRTQIVTYHADHENGYVADVTYEGQAVYPPEPKEGYGYHPKKYAHAPAKYAPAPAKYAPAPTKYAPAPPKYTTA